jgi:predicted acyltransferase
MNVSPALPAQPRLESLDALRGFTMFWIVGADALAGAFRGLDGGVVAAFLGRQLGHADWVGFTFYDLIFPLFLFMIGVAVPLSLDGIVGREGRAVAVRRVLRRGLLMYALGVLYYGGIAHGWDQIRWVGVLQRLAVCYVAAGLLHLWLKPRTIAAVGVALLLVYWALLAFVPVPGFGAGDYARGHNLANWIDAHFLPGKVWYGDYDPEGLLSTLPAIVSALLGLFAGRWLRDAQLTAGDRTRRLVVAGLVLLALGGLWSLQFPVIKRIWTSSYVLVAGGWSMLLLAAFYQMIDVRGWRGWTPPLVWIGGNALTIYLVSKLVDFNQVSAFLVGGEIAAGFDALWPGLGGLVRALTGIVLCTVLCGFLHARKIFLRI